MGFDAMAHDASVPSNPKDVAKKKRVNRSAKLKQCKLDARREQWLSQVKNKGSCKVTGMSASPSLHPQIPMPKSQQVRIREDERDGSGPQDSDFESPAHSPGSSTSSNPLHKEFFNGGGSSISSACSMGYCSPSASDTEDGCGDNGAVDDWEAVADALSADNDNDHGRHDSDPVIQAMEPQSITLLKSPDEAGTVSERELSKPEPLQPVPCAWRPDDVFRPQSLPNLSKQLSFPADIERHRMTMGAWTHHGILSAPSSCPICYEDLDSTDSSFLPCSCGFLLCLFCHKRILEDDGRCPGCRKQYAQAPAAGADVGIGGSGVLPLPVHLSRSCSIKY